ncbi:Crp/Fnr family transcriptional regulator [Desulfovibrio inopinatus]|uniref:Crp/Fnr family transcriptional regulator n=1 Tax=Desulfovibrio inopinatus TaxID=102109 RepID=UPI00040D9FB1|nr:cyclic nucleotide-binding domain-containing protein [Desulfovibrio inopinatus]
MNTQHGHSKRHCGQVLPLFRRLQDAVLHVVPGISEIRPRVDTNTTSPAVYDSVPGVDDVTDNQAHDRFDSMKAIEKEKYNVSTMLRKTPWGKDFSDDEITVLVEFAEIVLYEDGEYIFHDGEDNDYMALIIKGQVEIFKKNIYHRKKVITTLEKGMFFGEMSLIDREKRSASAKAKAETALLVISRQAFQDVCKANLKLGFKILLNISKILSRRLRQTTERVLYTA